MSDDPMGDDVYQPTESDTRDNREDVDLDNALDQKLQDGTLDEGYSPPEKPLAVTGHGTTAAEQRDRETLDQRLSEELPEVGVPDGNGIGDQVDLAGEPRTDLLAGEERAGRLAADDSATAREGADINARDVGIAGGAASAEEAAMHITEGEGEAERDEEPPAGTIR